MKKKNTLTDRYGALLEVGMTLSPVCGDALLIGEGIISKINYKNNTLELSNKYGDIISYVTNPKGYTKKEKVSRYTLAFYSKLGYVQSKVSLDQTTTLDAIPEYAHYATLCYNQPNKTTKRGYQFKSKELMTFYSKEKAHQRTINLNDNNKVYLEIHESGVLSPLNSQAVELNTENDLLITLQSIVKYFNKKYSTEFEESYIIKENEDIKRFNKNLSSKLNRLK